jgi:hypothetical protein
LKPHRGGNIGYDNVSGRIAWVRDLLEYKINKKSD